MPRRNNQKGGGSDFAHSFYANTAIGGPAAISRATLQNIAKAPVFNPLSTNTVIPTIATGITPVGQYFAQSGGGQLSKLTVPELRTMCNEAGMSCRDSDGNFLPKRDLIEMLAME